jgi:hypothetical protein
MISIKLAMAVFAWCLVSITASAQSNKADAVNELTGEMLECSIYYIISANCIEGHPDPDAPELVKTYKGLANDIAVLAISIGKSVGVSEDAVNARLGLISKNLMGSIGNKCVMINVLFDRYDNFCKQLAKNVDARLKELLAGKKCSGIYRCK